jgi:hypothetical protein
LHRDKKRCHEKYDETNAHHPHMHSNRPFFDPRTISDYSENGPGTGPKNRAPWVLWCTVPKNGIASALFHTGHENKPQIRGVFLASAQRGAFSPQPPRNPPYLHHKNTTLKRDYSQNPPQKTQQKSQSPPISSTEKKLQNSDIK